MTTASPRVWLVVAMAVALACVLLARSADAADASSDGGSGYGCNPATDKTCKPEGGVTSPVVLPSGGADLDGDGDGDGDDDELPEFSTHLVILGHAH